MKWDFWAAFKEFLFGPIESEKISEDKK